MAKEVRTTAESQVSQTRGEVIREAKRIEESLLHSSKGHFYAASFWSGFHLWVGIPLVVLSAIVATAYAKDNSDKVVFAIIPIVVAILSALITFLNPSERATNHLKAANELDSLMNRTRIFWTIECLSSDPDQVLTSVVADLSNEKGKLNAAAPQIPFFSYRKSKKGIERGEGRFEVDKGN